MQPDYARFWPYAISLLAVLLIYRRLRRSFGPQPVRPARMWIRSALLVLLGCSLLPLAFTSAQFCAAQLAGAASGVTLGIWGARHTRYAYLRGVLHYVPHTTAGIAVTLLFVGRLAYRVVEWYSQNRASGGGAASAALAPPSMVKSPLTVGLIFVLVGYYVCFFAIVLWKSKHIRPEELEAVAAPAAASDGGRGASG